MKRVLFIFIIGMMTIIGTPAAGWWDHGHSHIIGGAVPQLPEPLRSFFEANVNTVHTLAGQEPPGTHYIDIDYYPEFFAGTFPRNLNDLIAIHGASVVNQNGKGPWTYANYVNTLSNLMAAAQTKQDWLNLIPVAAAQAHYIEDLHNPLHLTLNYNGQLSGNYGIHARYEAEMVYRHLNDLTFTSGAAEYLPSVIDSVFDGIDVRYDFVNDIIAADNAALALAGSYNDAYYASMWAQTGAFTHNLFQDAADAVASGWYTAWVNAGMPTPNLGLAGDYNSDGQVDAADYAVWRKEYGNQTALDTWRANFGNTLHGSASAIDATQARAVPEPASALLAAVAALIFASTSLGIARSV